MEIIPAIDIIEGNCVRLAQGDFKRRTVYSKDPIETAKQFVEAGLSRLHMVDLDGARTGHIANLKILNAVAANTDLAIDFGGGIRSGEDVDRVLDAGAQMISVGSIAVKGPEVFLGWLEKFGPEKFILGADVRDGSVSINGWQSTTNMELFPFLAGYQEHGVMRAFVTDIARDGQLQGPSIALYETIRSELPDLHLIASGGVGTVADVEQLKQIGCSGVIIGKAIYEGTITLKELSEYAG